MAVGDATKWFTQQGGDPATGFVSGADGVQSITQVYSDMSVADDALVPKATVGNLLPANAASGGDTLGDASGSTTSGVTLARSTSTAVQGTGCITATVTVTSAWAIYSPNLGLSAVPVTPGQTYTASAYVKSTTASVAGVSVRIRWFTSAGSSISDSAVIYTVNSSTWTYMLSSAVAPATAAYASFVFGSSSNNQNEVFYLDCLGLWQGAGGLWALPGTPIANLGTYTDESVGRRIFTWDTVNSRWNLTYGDTGWRNVTALATNFSGGNIYLRRVGDRVSIIAVALASAAALDGTNLNGTIILPHTTGFEPALVGIESNAIINQGGGYWQQMATNNSATDIRFARMHRMGSDYPTVWAAGAAVYFEKSYSTTVAWPTALPGTASGAIPA